MFKFVPRRSNFTESATALVGVFFILLWLLAIGGYISNIVKLFVSANDPLTTIIILRGIGIVLAPLGAVLGFL